MLKSHLTNSWTIFGVLVFAVVLMMIGARPELQPRPSQADEAPGPTIALVGQLLALTSGTVLTYRMVRGTRDAARTNKPSAGA
jgi:hypothetical protein